MTIYQFMSDSPWLAGFIFFCLLFFGFAFVLAVFEKGIKSINIYKHGYPPPYCDAYGDGIGFEKEIDLEVS